MMIDSSKSQSEHSCGRGRAASDLDPARDSPRPPSSSSSHDDDGAAAGAWGLGPGGRTPAAADGAVRVAGNTASDSDS
jgi:hypothetical protein